MGQAGRFEKIGWDQIIERARRGDKENVHPPTPQASAWQALTGLVVAKAKVERSTLNVQRSTTKFDLGEGGSAAPSGDAKLGAGGALILASSKGLLDPPTSVSLLHRSLGRNAPARQRAAVIGRFLFRVDTNP